MVLSVSSITKSFVQGRAVDDVCFDVAASEMVAILGPSGCGKTTLLRMIAGFIKPDAGTISIAGREISAEPPHTRNTGMVFQNYALFPHLTVAKNISFGLEMRGVAKAEAGKRIQDALRMVRLEGMDDRYPRQLSGGQQQRVAIARALVINPDVFLLDEPLSNLDAKLRQSVGQEIRDLQRSLHLTTVFVTHDQHEALALADRLILMNGGKVAQIGTAAELYARPNSIFVANFLGRANLLKGRVADKGCFTLESGPNIRCDTDEHSPLDKATLCLRPEHLSLSQTSEAFENAFEGRITAVAHLGASTEATVILPSGESLLVSQQNGPLADVALSVGQECRISWPARVGLVIREDRPS